MKLPELIKQFITKKIELINYCLPHFYPEVDSFESFQIGYKIHGNTGEKITGEKEGDFKDNWFVICTGYASDPFFIDINEEKDNFPVYFAWHGAGNWTPIKTANNITQFTEKLMWLKEVESSNDNIRNIIKDKIDLNNEFWQEVYNEYPNEDE